jgi:hypothetical protein
MMKILVNRRASVHFSGHETFPLRQMWLKKAFDQAIGGGRVLKATFTDEKAIASFGVGKNMVSSIRHWALACDVLRESPDNPSFFEISPIAGDILSDGGLDPYAENQVLLGMRIGGLRARATAPLRGAGFSTM